MRRIAVLALIVLAASLRAAEGEGGKLDDDALHERFAAIAESLSAKGLIPFNGIVAPERLKDEMDMLDQALAKAADPKGESAVFGRLLRARLLAAEGKGGASESELKSVIDSGGDPEGVGHAYETLATTYAEQGRVDELERLADSAAKSGLPQELASMLRRMVTGAGIVVGKPAPDFTLTDTAGVVRRLADYRGKVLLVDFWATWCPPCVREMPNVKAGYDAYHARGFELIGVTLDEEREPFDRFVEAKALPWPQAFEGKGWGGDLVRVFGVTRVPASFLIGPDGNLIAKDLRGEELDQALAQALAK
jgi:peroxiredoxin